MAESKYLNYRNNSLHYVKAGSGNQPLLFFHGFGQDHSVYVPLIRALSDQYDVYVFDLYFHGDSKWSDGERPLEKEEWKETITQFLSQNEIQSFSIVGFSLGGKFALATLEAFPDRINTIFLLAPDGIKTSFWYSMATYPFVLRKFFKGMVDNYNRFTLLAEWLERLKLVDKGLIRFADYQMGTKPKRERVYYSWVVFRHLNFNQKKLAAVLNRHEIRTVIVVGKYDKVIVADDIAEFAKLLNKVEFEVLESGHTGLIYESLPIIRKHALDQH